MPETKEDLKRKIETLEAQIAELSSQVSVRDVVISESNTPGWVIKCPNEKYTGYTAGVRFENGRGFIPDRGPESAAMVSMLVGDFGYVAERL